MGNASEQFRGLTGVGEPDPGLGLENAKGKAGKPIDLEARDAEFAVGPDRGTPIADQVEKDLADEKAEKKAPAKKAATSEKKK